MTAFAESFVAAALAFIVVAVPLAYATDIYDYALLPKQFALFLGVAAAAFGWFLRTLAERHASFTRSSVFLPLACFAAWACVSSVVSTHPLDSLYELLYQVALIGLALAAANALPRQRVRWILSVGVITSLPISLLGVLQYLDLAPFAVPTNGYPSATFGFRNFAAMYLVGILPLAGLLWLTARSWPERVLYSMATTLGATFLVYTRTRGAWVGAIGASLTVAAITLLVPSARRRVGRFIAEAFDGAASRGLAVAGVLAIIGLSLLPSRFTDVGLQRFDEKKADVTSAVASILEGSGRGRQSMWTNTARMIGDHAVLGVGPGGWKRVYPLYDHGDMIRPDSAPRRPHNDFLWIASEYGLVGLGLFLWFLAQGLLSIRRMGGRDETFWALASPAFAVSVLAILIHGCFSFPREQPQAALFIYLLIGIAVGSESGRHRSTATGRAFLAALLICSTGASLLAWRWMAFDRHYLKAILLEDGQKWEEVRGEIEQAVSGGVFRPHAHFVLGRATERLGAYDKAIESYERALDRDPNAWYVYNGLGIVAKKQGNYDAAVAAYDRALRLYPDSDQVRTNQGALFKEQGDRMKQQGYPPLADSFYRKAEDAYRKVATSFTGVHNNLGNLYKTTGRLDSARAAYQTALSQDSTMVQAHYNLADLYMRTDRPEDALAHYDRAARLEPENARIIWAFGLALETVGRISDAEKAFGRTVVLDPAFGEAHYKLGNLSFERGDFDLAAEAFRRFLEMWKGDPVYADFAKERLTKALKSQSDRR